MSKQQESKNIGNIFLIVLLLNLAIVALAMVLGTKGIALGYWSTVLAEISIFIPVVIYLKKTGEPILETLGFHKIRISTVLLTLLLNITITPIWVFGNTFSQLFVPNTLAQGVSGMMEVSAAPIMMIVSFLPPIFEEILFRGLIFNKYKKASTILKAALVSALFFGLIHLNLNQFCYAFLLGAIFAFVNTASGSIITSMILHFLINGFNMLMLYAVSLASQATGEDYMAQAEAVRQAGILGTVIIYFVLAVLFSLISWLIMRLIAKNEGHLEEFMSIFRQKTQDSEERAHIFRTVPALISTVLGIVSIGVISFVLPTVF